LVQDYETTFGDEPTQTGVNYWFHDAEADRFRIIFFSNNGPFSEEATATKVVWRTASSHSWGRRGSNTKLGADGAVGVNPDGTISIRWWIRDEDGEWQPWMANTFSRSD
jgi:hypothetical protein